MPSLKDRLDAAVEQLKRDLTADQITQVIALITLFIEADRKGALIAPAPHEEGE